MRDVAELTDEWTTLRSGVGIGWWGRVELWGLVAIGVTSLPVFVAVFDGAAGLLAWLPVLFLVLIMLVAVRRGLFVSRTGVRVVNYVLPIDTAWEQIGRFEVRDKVSVMERVPHEALYLVRTNSSALPVRSEVRATGPRYSRQTSGKSPTMVCDRLNRMLREHGPSASD